jgi:two-component system, cell cycle sensor histidine kinase PleC
MELIRSDGLIMARYTPEKGLDKASIGLKTDSLDAVRSGSLDGSGEFTGPSTVDGVVRLYHWHKIPGYPLYVAAGLGKSEALASANFQAWIVTGLGIAALSLPLIMMLMLNREISRRVEHAVSLDRQSEKVRQEHVALLAITEELAKERVKLRKTNKQLTEARRKAEEASRAKSAFLANMSHELRTPLNAILGFSEIIRDKLFGSDIDRYADYAADIHRSGTHLLNIVSNILDITRIEAGKIDLREEEVPVREVIEEAVFAVAQQASASRISLTCARHDIGASILGDKTKLTQILINLLSNAIKFTYPGGSVDIAIAGGPERGLLLTIKDTGIGMSREEIKNALELFGQVDKGMTRRFQGTGLGLPLAVQLTELHGGTLTVSSTPNIGTAVEIRFPKERVSWEKEPAQRPASVEAPRLRIAS